MLTINTSVKLKKTSAPLLRNLTGKVREFDGEWYRVVWTLGPGITIGLWCEPDNLEVLEVLENEE